MGGAVASAPERETLEQPTPASGRKDVEMTDAASPLPASKFTSSVSKEAASIASKFAPESEKISNFMSKLEARAEVSTGPTPLATPAARPVSLPEPAKFETDNGAPVLNVPTLES